MLVDWIHNGKQVVAPVRIDSLSKQNNIRIDANSVTTVFGKDNVITKLLDTAIKKEEAGEVAIYYLDKEKASSLMSGAGLQLPGGRISSGFIHNIYDPDSPVKPVIADQTDTQQFNRWFKNSKIVNEDGSPKVVYHGSPNQFTEFDYSKLRTNVTTEGVGFYFTDNKNVAEGYANKGDSGKLYEAYLNISKPLNSEKKTITKMQLRTFIDAFNKYEASLPDNEGVMAYLSNFGDYEHDGYQSDDIASKRAITDVI